MPFTINLDKIKILTEITLGELSTVNLKRVFFDTLLTEESKSITREAEIEQNMQELCIEFTPEAYARGAGQKV